MLAILKLKHDWQHQRFLYRRGRSKILVGGIGISIKRFRNSKKLAGNNMKKLAVKFSVAQIFSTSFSKLGTYVVRFSTHQLLNIECYCATLSLSFPDPRYPAQSGSHFYRRRLPKVHQLLWTTAGRAHSC
jgi:hypothetical protein